MSKFFLKSFKARHKCWACKEDKLSGYSLCEKHLTKARNLWRSWGFERREEGLCISCDRKSFKGWLRCKIHTAYNRKKCLAWTHAHPEHAQEAWRKKQTLRAAGFCPQCPQHRKLKNGAGRCWVCSTRNRLRDKLGVEGMRALFHERYGTRFDRKLITAAA